MRIIFTKTMLSVCMCLSAATAVLAFDPAAEPSTAPDLGEATTPREALRFGARAYYSGDKQAAVNALRFAAENGMPAAQWKLGRMYAEGDGVAEDDLKAFGYFSRIANQHADEGPRSPHAPYVASAFVAIGAYYMTGIHDTAVKPNVRRARDLFSYAASYFGSAEAQYNLGRMYLDGDGGDNNPHMAARWFKLAAEKGHCRAQAMLGNLLFTGEKIRQNRARGLMWLTVARQKAGPADRAWVQQMHEKAFALASEDERRRAMTLAEGWTQKYAGLN
ncbi:sel1 repeat family protein [Breoghania sp. L-A4]|nr:sel1 repeat family protein [Breoghania sp. L-A4]